MQWSIMVAFVLVGLVGNQGRMVELAAVGSRIAVIRLVAVPQADTSGWELLRTQGMMQFVLVAKPREADPAVYRRAIRALCKPGKHCFLLFWSDRRQVPSRMPMTDRQASAQVASYTKNPATRFEEMLWNCRIKNDPQTCFR